VGDCVPQALAYYRNWRAEANPDEKNPVPINVRSTVYCTSVKHGFDSDWEFLWTRYKKSNVAAEKRTILTALGCSREVWLLQRYMEMIFDAKEGIRKGDSKWAFQAVAKTEVGFLPAKKYLMDNIGSISD